MLLLLNRLLRVERPHPVDPIRVQMEIIRMAVMGYDAREGKYPDSLDALIQPPYRQLKKEDLNDPWGEPFGYEHDGDNYVIWSSGPDKKMGTADDIVTGFPPSYVASWKAKHIPPVGNQETNVVQEATTETIKEKEKTR